jgi:tRNA1(Val) A37 N6-methylase TrmN6
MAERFGHHCAGKLASRGFRRGKGIDVVYGLGAMVLILAGRFPDREFVGIDLSDPLLLLAKRSAEVANLEERTGYEKADV